MLRYIKQPLLCNGTRLTGKKLTNDVIEATKGKYTGDNILIPRIPMIQTDWLFNFKRLQFPVLLAFAKFAESFPVSRMDNNYTSLARVLEIHHLYIFTQHKKTKNIAYQNTWLTQL